METPSSGFEQYASTPPAIGADRQAEADIVQAATSGWAGGISGTVGGASYIYTTNVIGGDPQPSNGPIVINEYTALTIPGVWSGVRFLSETLAGLPKHIIQKSDPLNRQRDHQHPLDYLLNAEASDLVAAPYFWTVLYHHAIVWGNGYAFIDFTPDGTPAALYNLPPDRVIPFRWQGRQWYALQIIYDYNRPTQQWRAIPAEQVLHIPGFGFDSMRGYPVFQMMVSALRIGKSAEAFGDKFFSNGGHVNLTLSTDRVLTSEQIADLKHQIQANNTGIANAHKALVLQNGLKAESLTTPPDSAQYLQTRQFSILDICRILRVEPFVLYDYGRATWGNLEQQNTTVVQYSLMPWIVKTESECARKLLTVQERKAQGYTVKVCTDALTRGDTTQAIDNANKRLTNGLTTLDEERAGIDLPPYPDAKGATPRVPVNTVPLGQQPAQNAGNQPKPVQASASNAGEKFDAAPPKNIHPMFAALVADAAQRVHRKTDMAKANHAAKIGTDQWVPWVNTFSEEQEGYAAAAVGPILATHAAATGQQLDHEAHGKKIGRTYGSKLRGHLYSIGKGGNTPAPDLQAITMGHDLTGGRDEPEAE